MTSYIDQDLTRDIEMELKSHGEKLWHKLSFDIQDGFKFLLIIIDDITYSDDKKIKEICDLVKKAVEPRIPPRKDGYSWMAVIRKDGKVIESVFPEML